VKVEEIIEGKGGLVSLFSVTKEVFEHDFHDLIFVYFLSPFLCFIGFALMCGADGWWKKCSLLPD
jgi:hypothetical protein